MSDQTSPATSIRAESPCFARINTLYPHFTPADRAIAHLTIHHPQMVDRLSSRELGRQCGVSEASVVRFAKKLGYAGFPEFKNDLHHDILVSETLGSTEFLPADSGAEVLSKVIALGMQALRNLTSVLDTHELERAARVLSAARCIHFFAAGGSASVAQQAAFKLMRMGYMSVAYVDFYTQKAQASLIDASGAVMGISYTGSTGAVIDALAVARENGATTICITNFSGTPILEVADIRLITGAPGGILAANSAPSRVAQFAALEALCALIGPREGGREAISA